jgi:NAD(P)H dehydrogenase (quinone)
LALYNTIYHFGGLVVAPGYTDPLKFADGNPYGVSHVTGGNNSDPLTDVQYAALDHLVTRAITVTGRLKKGATAS